MAPPPSRSIFVVPTELERAQLLANLGTDVPLLLGGFGPIVAAARTMQLIEAHRPAQVILVGIAGRYDESLDLGRAYVFDRVACYGIGSGEGPSFRTSAQMGWPQWPGLAQTDEMDDRLPLTLPDELGSDAAAGTLLTVTSSSTSQIECQHRRRLFPAATAEDMEAFGVAVACHMNRIPLVVIRGISNQAGERNKPRWQVEPALAAVADLIRPLIPTT